MKNLKGFLTNTIAILVGVLTLVFMSQPYFNYVFNSIIGGASAEGVSGYEIIGNYFETEDAKAIILALSCLIMAVLAGILILFGIFNLLTSTGVAKVKNAKVMNVANCLVSILMLIVGVVGIICASLISKDTSFNGAIGGIQLANGTNELSWAIIVNLVLSFVAVCSTTIATIGSRKTKRKKK